MPCQDALTTKVFTLRPDHTVEQALKVLRDNKAAFAPVVEDGKLAGVFSLGRLLQNTLPVSVAMGAAAGGGGFANVRIPAAPGLGRRLQKSKVSTVAEIMDRSAPAVMPDTPLDVAIRLVAQRAEPVCVVDASGTFLGTVTEDAILAALEKDGEMA